LPTGECTPAREQLPLVSDPVFSDPEERILAADIDMWPFKLRTDVVVRGHAYNHRRKSTYLAGVRVGQTSKQLTVHGDRHCTLAQDGRILWSNPTVLDRIPLSYAHAYGGRDAQGEKVWGNPAEDMAPFLGTAMSPEMIADASPFIYPRNPLGRGYVVEKTREALENLPLPNFEDPRDPLTPDRLVVGDVGRWPLQPLPAGLGWLDYGFFPRNAWLGQIPYYEPSLDRRMFSEIRFEHASPTILDETPMGTGTPSLEGANGASLGLRVPYLRGNDEFELLNLSANRETMRFRLAKEQPTLWVDGRDGKLLRTTDAVIHSVIIEPDEARVSVVWRGSSLARRPYMAEELPTMPFLAEW
jgi:hypothetical protein